MTATITTATPTVITREVEETEKVHERRPSWRLKVDGGSKVCTCKTHRFSFALHALMWPHVVAVFETAVWLSLQGEQLREVTGFISYIILMFLFNNI